MAQPASEETMTRESAGAKIAGGVAFVRSLAPFYLTALVAAIFSGWLITSTPVGDQLYLFRDKVAPDVDTGISLYEKLLNDYGISPRHYIIDPQSRDVSQMAPVAGFAPRGRRGAAPMVFSAAQGRDDYVFIAGAFDFPDSLHGALLLNRRGEIVHEWRLRPSAAAQRQFGGEYRIFPHGIEPFADGSLIAAFDGGVELLKVDACSNQVWAQPGKFHHAVTRDPENADAVWSWRENEAVKIDAATGEKLYGLQIAEILAANRDLDVMGVLQDVSYAGYEWHDDPFHQNDVEPLPAAFAAAFPMFSAGDLLISMRAINTVMVLDPQTAKIKWHASGYWRRQHDPDWAPDGRIRVYNNNMHRGNSTIVAIDPATRATEKLIDGASYDFYSRIRGKQQWSDDGSVLLTIPDQGRAIEIGADGEKTFEFFNLYQDDGRAMVVSEARRLPADFFNWKEMEKCKKQQSLASLPQ